MNVLPSNATKGILPILLTLFFCLQLNAQNGQQIFQQQCGTCHAIDRDLTGPRLRDVESRGPWAEGRENLYRWMNNPAAFMAGDPYTQGLKQQYGSIMPGFPQLSQEDVDAIFDWIKTVPPPGQTEKGTPPPGGPPGDSNRNALIFGVISLILALIALILMQVNSNLKKLSDDKEGIIRPEPVPFWRNKIYIALFAILFFIVGGFYVGKGAIGLGRQQGYQPTQPIYFSHKVHAGINQINCLYCHGGATESKHAGIPSLNVCMNCHLAVTTYEKGPKLFDDKGNEINGTQEINKLFKFAGFTPGPGATWNPARAKSPEWVKIHNLPDHVYFNHAQHVTVGNVACQTCHGNIQEMDKVYQASELSMGWCVNCHRDSKVNFNYSEGNGNKFYSIYEKFHNDIRNNRMDSVTVRDIGGLECQKCHY